MHLMSAIATDIVMLKWIHYTFFVFLFLIQYIPSSFLAKSQILFISKDISYNLLYVQFSTKGNVYIIFICAHRSMLIYRYETGDTMYNITVFDSCLLIKCVDTPKINAYNVHLHTIYTPHRRRQCCYSRCNVVVWLRFPFCLCIHFFFVQFFFFSFFDFHLRIWYIPFRDGSFRFTYFEIHNTFKKSTRKIPFSPFKAFLWLISDVYI